MYPHQLRQHQLNSATAIANAPQKTRKPTACSNCKQVGHNRAKCPLLRNLPNSAAPVMADHYPPTVATASVAPALENFQHDNESRERNVQIADENEEESNID